MKKTIFVMSNLLATISSTLAAAEPAPSCLDGFHSVPYGGGHYCERNASAAPSTRLEVPHTLVMQCQPSDNSSPAYKVSFENGTSNVMVTGQKLTKPYPVINYRDNKEGYTFYVAAKRHDQNRTLYFAFDYSGLDRSASGIRVKAPGYDAHDKCTMDWNLSSRSPQTAAKPSNLNKAADPWSGFMAAVDEWKLGECRPEMHNGWGVGTCPFKPLTYFVNANNTAAGILVPGYNENAIEGLEKLVANTNGVLDKFMAITPGAAFRVVLILSDRTDIQSRGTLREQLIATLTNMRSPAAPTSDAPQTRTVSRETPPPIDSNIRDGHFSLVEGNIIKVDGEIVQGDSNSFDRLAAQAKGSAVVVFNSPGGVLMEGLAIGESIKNRGFRTTVYRSCASACAYAWLAGKPRFMAPNAQVIFHSPYRENDPSHADGTANTAAGAYLAEIGIDLKAAMTLTGHDPRSYYVIDAGDPDPIIPFTVTPK